MREQLRQKIIDILGKDLPLRSSTADQILEEVDKIEFSCWRCAICGGAVDLTDAETPCGNFLTREVPK